MSDFVERVRRARPQTECGGRGGNWHAKRAGVFHSFIDKN